MARYYEDLFKRGVWTDNNLVENTIQSLVTSQQNDSLCSIPNEEEIRVAIFSMNVSSAHGPDGFGVGFYKEC